MLTTSVTAVAGGNNLLAWVTVGINAVMLIVNAIIDIYRKFRDKDKDLETKSTTDSNVDKTERESSANDDTRAPPSTLAVLNTIEQEGSMRKFLVKQTGTYTVRAVGDGKIVVSDSELSNQIRIDSLSADIERIKDLFPDPEERGIFYLLSQFEGSKIAAVLAQTGIDDMHSIDMEYIYNSSGMKKVSMLVTQVVEKSVGIVTGTYPVTDEVVTRIMTILNSRFADKWEKLWATITVDFDPLTPYNMEISDTVKDKSNNTTIRSSKTAGSDKSNVYGFNGSTTPDGNPADSSSYESKGEGSDTLNKSGEKTRTLTRKGNIGNTTLQELIDEQRRMLQWQFFNIAFADVDSVISSGAW